MSDQALQRTAFEVKVNVLARALVVVAHMLLFWLYYSVPMFYLPEAWSGPLRPLLAFPFAPEGN